MERTAPAPAGEAPPGPRNRLQSPRSPASSLPFPPRLGRPGRPPRSAPKRPASAYFLFQADMRASIVASDPSLQGKVAEQAKVIGAKWKALSDAQRAPYELTAKQNKEEFEAKFGKVTVAKKSKAPKDPNAPKVKSSYMIFCAQERGAIIAKHPELKSQVTEVAKLLGAKWRELSQGEKDSYKE